MTKVLSCANIILAKANKQKLMLTNKMFLQAVESITQEHTTHIKGGCNAIIPQPPRNSRRFTMTKTNTNILSIFVTNLGKYNEGELVGEWLELPATDEEI